LIEFAMVLPVIVMLVLGLTSGATAWNQSQALGHGGQVAGRFAATLPVPASSDDMDDWLDDIIDRAVSASEGKMAAGAAGRAICVAFVDPAGSAPDNTVSRRLDASGVRTDGTSECFADGQGTTVTRVQILMERSSYIELGFHRQTLELSRQVVYRYEADSGI
jgi:Flp pilus assembly protein TadG